MSGENRVKFSERIYERAKALWPRYLTHPFVTEMADGTLPKEKFRCYMVQDYLYLRRRSPMRARTSTTAPTAITCSARRRRGMC